MGTAKMVVIVILALVLFFAIGAARLFNRLLKFTALYEEGWSGVLAALKRRRDLIPGLVEIASECMGRESKTLRDLARAGGLGRSARGVAEMADAEARMAEALVSFNGAVENCPALKADKNMRHIQEELSVLDVRIEKVRLYYNATVRDYNMEVARFPANLISGAMGFKRAVFFETDRPSEDDPGEEVEKEKRRRARRSGRQDAQSSK